MSEIEAKKIAEIEALLFQYGEPLEIKKMAKLLEIKEEDCRNRLQALETEFKQSPNRGLMILNDGAKAQLVTKPELQNITEALVKEEFKEELTPAALETISIVAYLGPVPRMTVDFVRGVNSSFILRNLLMRGLVEREPNPKRRNVYDYRVSFDFLKHVGLGKIEELPEYGKYSNALKQFEIQQQTQEVIEQP